MEAPNLAAATAAISQNPPLSTSEEAEPAVKGRPIRKIGSKVRTFDRRRHRLFKAASEISILCDAEVAAIVFSPSGRMSEFASSSTNNIIRRYESFQHEMPSNNVLLQDVKVWKHEEVLFKEKSIFLEEFQRYMFEKNMPFSISEVKSVETILKDTLIKIRSRKADLLKVEAQKVVEKGESICKGNHVLQQMLTQLFSTNECLNNDSSEWYRAYYHQDVYNTTSHLGLDILQGTQNKED